MASTTSSAPEDWIGDAVLGYLSSPLLRTPIENFLDNYCSLFEASEENKLEYQEIHQQFTELVDSLLTAQLAEMSITAEQFESLARQIYSSKSAPQAQGMLESVLFYDDFLRFKQAMVARNLALQAQADSLAHIESKLPAKDKELSQAVSLSKQIEVLSHMERRRIENEDESALEKGIRASLEQAQLDEERRRKREEEELARALKLSSVSSQPTASAPASQAPKQAAPSSSSSSSSSASSTAQASTSGMSFFAALQKRTASSSPAPAATPAPASAPQAADNRDSALEEKRKQSLQRMIDLARDEKRAMVQLQTQAFSAETQVSPAAAAYNSVTVSIPSASSSSSSAQSTAPAHNWGPAGSKIRASPSQEALAQQEHLLLSQLPPELRTPFGEKAVVGSSKEEIAEWKERVNLQRQALLSRRRAARDAALSEWMSGAPSISARVDYFEQEAASVTEQPK